MISVEDSQGKQQQVMSWAKPKGKNRTDLDDLKISLFRMDTDAWRQMTPDQKRINELKEFIHAIDFTCRACMTAEEAIPLIQNLCTAANVQAVILGRRMNEPKESLT